MQFNKIIGVCLGMFLVSCTDNSQDYLAQLKTSISSIDTVLDTQVILKPNEGLVYFENEPFSGVSVSYYPNNQLKKSIQYTQGKKSGEYARWHPNGLKSYTANYVLGKLDGVSKTWWNSGSIRSLNQFENGKAHGQQLQWYKSGVVFKELNYVHGREDGMQKAWRDNGKIYNNYEAKNGRFFGLKRATLCYELEDEIVQN